MCELTARHGWQGNGMGSAWARHAICELTARHGWQGNGMGSAWAWRAMYELAFKAVKQKDIFYHL